MIEEEDFEVYYPPIGYGEKEDSGVLYSVEELNENGLTILAVFARKDCLDGLSKEELMDKLVALDILQLNDPEYPTAELSSFYSEEEKTELLELDIVLADEDYVYAECKLKLKYE